MEKPLLNNQPTYAGKHWGTYSARDRAQYLDARRRAGEITELEFQPEVMLTDASLRFILDFSYRERGALVYELVRRFNQPEREKAAAAERCRVLARLWPAYGPGALVFTTPAGGHVPRGAVEVTKRIAGKGNS